MASSLLGGVPGRRIGVAAAGVVTLIGVTSIVLSWGRLSPTIDEANHLATGLEWIQNGTYGMWTENPPLPRVAVALVPYLAGARLPPPESYQSAAGRRVSAFASWKLGTDLLDREGRPLRNLAQARAGTLPFFVLAVLLTGLLAARAGGWLAGVIAAIAMATLPPLLGNSSVATTDVAFLATFLLSLWTFLRWLDRPSPGRSAALGAAAAAAVLSKFTALVFFPVAVGALLVFGPERLREGVRLRGRLPALAVALVTAVLVLWAGYRFSIGRVDDPSLPTHGLGARIVNPPGERHGLEALFTRRALPAPTFFHGLLNLKSHNDSGHRAFLFGAYSQYGFRRFYPVALFFKAPLPFLLLLAIGLTAIVYRWREPEGRAGRALAVAAAVVLLALVPSRVNLGVRHALVVYALAGAAASVGIARLLASRWMTSRPGRRMAAMAALGAILAAHQAAALASYPDQIGSFNSLAGSDPGRILEGPDLDWGQGLYELARQARSRGIDRLQVALWTGFGSACKTGLPPLVALEPHTPVSGWVVVSQAMYSGRMEHFQGRDPCNPLAPRPPDPKLPPRWFSWLEAYQPVWLGSGLRLYHIP